MPFVSIEHGVAIGIEDRAHTRGIAFQGGGEVAHPFTATCMLRASVTVGALSAGDATATGGTGVIARTLQMQREPSLPQRLR